MAVCVCECVGGGSSWGVDTSVSGRQQELGLCCPDGRWPLWRQPGFRLRPHPFENTSACLSDRPDGRQCHPGPPAAPGTGRGRRAGEMHSTLPPICSHIPVILFPASRPWGLTQLHAVIYSLPRLSFRFTWHTLTRMFALCSHIRHVMFRSAEFNCSKTVIINKQLSTL